MSQTVQSGNALTSKRPRLSLLLLSLSFLLLSVTLQQALAASEPVRIVSRGDANADYSIGLVKLALSRYGNRYQYDISSGALTGLRQKQSLLDGTVDVVWTATNQDMENDVLPVRVPLYKGLLGYRVLLVHRDNAHLFDSVRTKGDLLRFRYGQGRGWTDSDIMEANGMTVVMANKYESLFYMTDGKRFDAFPRGVHEPWLEMKSRPELALTVDTNILLVYRMPFYLFVAPGRPQLAKDIENGLLDAIDDGSFDTFFYASPTVQMVIDRVDLSTRQVFELTNPALPVNTPVNNPKLWIDLDELKHHSNRT